MSSQNLHYSLDSHQLMRVHIALLIKYTGLVQIIDADFSRGMNDLLVANDDADMGDDAVFVAEEGEVAGLCFLKEINQFAAIDLLRGVAWQEQTRAAGTKLHEARAVDAHHGAAAPKVWRAKKFTGVVNHGLWQESLRHFGGTFSGFKQRRPEGNDFVFVMCNRLIYNEKLAVFQLKELAFVDGVMLFCRNPTFVLVEFGADENPFWFFV